MSLDVQRSINLIKKFDGKDFAVWRIQVQSLLEGYGYETVLTNSCPPEDKKAEMQSFLDKDKKVKSLLLLSLDNKFVKHVMKCSTSKEIWERLQSVHAQKSAGNKMVLQKQFFDLIMGRAESITDYISRVEYLASQLNDIGVETGEDSVAGKIVSGLGKKYQSFVSSWVATDVEKQTLENLTSRLLAEEQMQNRFEQPGSLALNVSSKGPKSKGGSNKKNGRTTSNSKNKPSDTKRKYTKEQLEALKNKWPCVLCQQRGHWKNECPQNKDKVEVTVNPSASTAKTEDCGNALVAEANLVSSSDGWVVDTGATDHMTNSDQSYVSYQVLSPPRLVRYGDGRQGQGVGVGDIVIRSVLPNGSQREVTLTNVLHVPGLKRKLVSLSCITDKGNHGEFYRDSLIVKNSFNQCLLMATKANGLYFANVFEASEANVASSTASIDLWHKRFGHINKRYLARMAKHNSVDRFVCHPLSTSLPEGNSVACSACALGKQCKISFPARSACKALRTGERVHVDICGPIATASIANSHYFVLYKDEYSDFRLIFFINNRTEAFDTMQKAVVKFQNDGKARVLKLISDRGSEFTSCRAAKFLLENKILHEVSAPHTPSQNGYIERENRTIGEAMRTMLFAKNLPEKFWAEAANTAVYVLNRCVCRNSLVTPFELFYGFKPKVNHLKVFGCIAFVKIPEKKRSGWQRKLDPRSQVVIHVGYDLDFTYRLYDPESNQITISREVHFNEDDSYKFNESISYVDLESWLSTLPEQSESDCNPDSHHAASESMREVSSSSRQEIAEAFGEHPEHDLMDISDLNLSFESANADEEVNSSLSQSHSLDLVDGREAPFMSTPTRQANVPPGSAINLRRRNDISIAEALTVVLDEPTSFAQAMSSSQAGKWKEAMAEEYRSLIKNGTWHVVPRPAGCRPIACRWVYKVKQKDDAPPRYKARLVAKGFSQQHGIDYHETFSPVVKVETIRTLLVLANHFNWEMKQMDVKTAFLHGKLEESIYMDPPPGYAVRPNHVCLLRKAIYGLKQASRQWNDCFKQFLVAFNLRPLKCDTCVFVNHRKGGPILIVCIYVDDGLIMSNDQSLLNNCLRAMQHRFEITINEPDTYVGMRIVRNRREGKMVIHQSQYIIRLLQKFEMADAHPVSTPMLTKASFNKVGCNGVRSKLVRVPYREAVGSLLYAAMSTRPDISFSLNVLSRFCSAPTLVHWNSVKRIMRYLVDKHDMGLSCVRQAKLSLVAHSDADLAGCPDTRKSTSGHLIQLCGTPIIWRSTRQKVVATSTCEAEFVSASQIVKDIIWVRNLLHELINVQLPPTPLMIDNLGAIDLIKNNQSNSKTKHLDIKLHHVRDEYEKRTVKLVPVDSENQLADVFTKSLPVDSFTRMMKFAGMTKLLFVVMMLAIMTPGNAMFLGERYKIQPHHFVVTYGTSCRVATSPQLFEEISKLGHHVKEEETAGKRIYPRSYELLQFEKCVLHNQRLEEIVERLPLAVRQKRTIVDTIYKDAIIASKIVKSMATIWCSGISKRVLLETATTVAHSLLKTLTDTAKNAFNKTSLVPKNLDRDEILAVSVHAGDYPALVDQVISQEDYLEKYIDYNRNEMSAGEVLLLALELSLKKGRLDTVALGELANDDELARLNPESMHVTRITHANRVLEIVVEQLIERSLSERIIWLDVLTVTGLIVAILVLLGAVLAYRKALIRDAKTRAAVQQLHHLDNVSAAGSHVPFARPSIPDIGSRGDVGQSVSPSQ